LTNDVNLEVFHQVWLAAADSWPVGNHTVFETIIQNLPRYSDAWCDARSYVSSLKFSSRFRDELEQLLRWRRDVRHFRQEPVDSLLLETLLSLAMLSPSVGFSQPWRWVIVNDPARRSAVLANFCSANERAAAQYDDKRAATYRELKLAGLREAPVHIAVFADTAANTGHGLGRQTMPETLIWSVVMAVHSLWLAARAEGLGMGWVSIVEPMELQETLDVNRSWTLVAYLCVGWPEDESETPLLEAAAWDKRLPKEELVLKR